MSKKANFCTLIFIIVAFAIFVNGERQRRYEEDREENCRYSCLKDKKNKNWFKKKNEKFLKSGKENDKFNILREKKSPFKNKIYYKYDKSNNQRKSRENNLVWTNNLYLFPKENFASSSVSHQQVVEKVWNEEEVNKLNKNLKSLCKEPNGLFPFPPDCDYYVSCASGRAFKQRCASGTKFSVVTSNCDWPSRAKCHKTFDNIIENNLVEEGNNCDEVDTYYFGHNIGKSIKILENGVKKCKAGCRRNKRCKFWSFMKRSNVCFYKSSDKGRMKGRTTIGVTSGPKYCGNARKGKVLFEKAAELCPSEFSGLLPHPDDCSKFINCWKGKSHVLTCGPGTRFNADILQCDHIHKTKCKIQVKKSRDPKDIKVMPAPPTGAKSRLRGGLQIGEGYLQIYLNDSWRFVCDDNWKMNEAEIVCRQLGFLRGAEKSSQGFIYGAVDQEEGGKSVRVSCRGREKSLEQCRVKNEKCSLNDNIVSVSCKKDSASACKADEVPWRGSCYKFVDKLMNFEESQNHCRKSGKHLLEIYSQAENNIISEMMLQKHLNIKSFRIGAKGIKVYKEIFWVWDNSGEGIEYKNWWYGWSDRKRKNDKSIKLTSGIKLKRQFDNATVDYFFWEVSQLDEPLTFICKSEQIDIGCLTDDDGQGYQGNANYTENGEPCLNWNSPEILERLEPEAVAALGDLKGNNFCRNPDGEFSPWCFINDNIYDYCDIPSCRKRKQILGHIEVDTCKSDEFRCGPNKCIYNAWVCDGEQDCEDKSDEVNCNSYLGEFKEKKKRKIIAVENERWLRTTAETCARRCVQAKSFECRSFSHEYLHNICVLSELNIGSSGALAYDKDWNYYENIEESITCEDKVRCASGKCLKSNQFCDGKQDCQDGDDEMKCENKIAIEMRLADGKVPNEGRVEINVLGTWGGICDDGFGIEDAKVICKEMGFHLGAEEAVLHSQYGSGDGVILIDDLECHGNESTILNCKFSEWGKHNCNEKEMAGVICRVLQDECKENEWKCENSQCITIDFLCDTVNDCGDNSDEDRRICDSELEVRLSGGTHASEGRIEIRHNGIWGTVCDDEFGVPDGQVICRMLGYEGSVEIHEEGYFGFGTGPIWLDELSCEGYEETIASCPRLPWGKNNCKHFEDVSITCHESDDIDDSYEIPEIFVRIASEKNNENVIPEGPFSCGTTSIASHAPKYLIDQNAKVIGGKTTDYGAHPWQASIRVRGSTKSFHWCGAAVIATKYVLTAAHCLEDFPKSAYIVRVGDFDTLVKDLEEQEFDIEVVHFHENFNQGPYLNNDLAIVKLKAKENGGIKFGKFVSPACLPEAGVRYKRRKDCIISGWGSSGTSSSGYARKLQAAKVPILDVSLCTSDKVYGMNKISSGMFCAGFLEGGIDSCQGDSGGPFICPYNGKSVLFGITSWGFGCGRPNRPGVYTKIDKYLDWINSVVKFTES